jgi:hypothetical protein
MKLKMVLGILLFLMSFSALSLTSTEALVNVNTYMSSSVCTGSYSCTAAYQPNMNGTNPQSGANQFRAQRMQGVTNYGYSYFAFTGAYDCTAPDAHDLVTGMCGAFTCKPPKFIQSSGMCDIPECVSYKVANTLTGVCQIPPVCGSTEYYVNVTNTCALSALRCPGHSHASTTNDKCLPDAPLACTSGQHDDGTYTCVANDATHCGVNQQMGYINGVRQCISSPPLDTAQQEATDKASAQTAINASNANSSDVGLANVANNKSNGALVAGQYDSNRLLESIANSTNDANNADKQKQASAGGDACDQPPACSGDQIQCEILKQSHKNTCRSKADAQLSEKEVGGSVDKIAGVFSTGIASDMGTGAFSGQQYVSTSFFNLSGSTCQTVQMNYKLLQYTFDPCTQLAMFRNLLGWFAYMYTAVSIVQLARQTS